MLQGDRLFAGRFVLEDDLQAAVNVRHVFEPFADRCGIELSRSEDVAVRLEEDGCAVPARGVEFLQRREDLAPAKGLLPLVPVALDRGDELARQSHDDRGADAVQTAGVDVAAVAEFAAGVQSCQNQFQRRDLVNGVDADRNPPAVVHDGDRVALFVEGDRDGVGVAVEVLIDGVIDDLPDKMVQTLLVHGPDVHPRPLAHRLQPFESFDFTFVVVGEALLRGGDAHGFLFSL